jgi:hypothetical protein
LAPRYPAFLGRRCIISEQLPGHPLQVLEPGNAAIKIVNVSHMWPRIKQGPTSRLIVNKSLKST